MGDTQWKKREREISERFGVQRLPSNGRNQQDIIVPAAYGIDRPALAIEMKARKVVPQLLFDALDQSKRNAVGDQLPVVIVSESQGRKNSRIPRRDRVRSFVLMDIDVFERFVKGDPATSLMFYDDLIALANADAPLAIEAGDEDE